MQSTQQKIGRRAALASVVGATLLGPGVVSANPGRGNGRGRNNGNARLTVGVGEAYQTIAEAIAAANPGDTIQITPGIYEEDSLVIDGLDNLTVQGAGIEEVTIRRPTGNRGLTVSNSDHVTLRGFTLRDTPSGAFGFKLQHSDGLNLREIRAIENGRTGIDLHTTNNATLRNVHAEGNDGVGIAIRNANNVRVQDGHTRNNAWGGVGLWAVGEESLTDITIRGSSFTDEPVGIYTEHDGSFEDILLHNNTYENCLVGVLNDGAVLDVRNSTFEIAGSSVDANARYILFTNGASGEITGNRGTGAHRIGIFVQGGGTDAVVQGNEINGLGPAASGNTQNGIQVGEAATAVVRNNRISDHWFTPRPGATGILVNDTTGVDVRQNSVRDCQIGIAIAAFFDREAHDNRLERNNVHGGIVGITMQAITDRGIDDATVRDNTIINNVLVAHDDGEAGIWETATWNTGNPHISGNLYRRNKIHGFDFPKVLAGEEILEHKVVTPSRS